MLSDTKLTLLQQLVAQSSKEEIIWTKGYLAGFLSAQNNGVQPVETPTAVAVKPLIVYGTETGNAKKIATQLLANFKKNKIQAKSTDIFQFDVTKLEKETLVLFIVSTQGEGEFPQNAVGFYEKLKASEAKLNQLNFAVLGLGDSSYPLFCNAGVLLDEVLVEKGAKRLLPLVKADVDFAPVVTQWETDLKNAFAGSNASASVVSNKAGTAVTSHKKNFKGIVSHKIVLNDRGSNKETYHIEIIPNEELVYEPGDAIGFYPKNSEQEIVEIVSFFDKNTQKEVLFDKNIRGLGKKSLELLSGLFGVSITEEKADLVDILKKYPKPETVSFEDVLTLLHPIAPRLYSISSAVNAHDGQVHITVNKNTFSIDGTLKTGLCSQFLADFPTEGEIEFYIHKNNNFKLPAEDKDIILIGPGTGIAPFRSFLAHRDAEGAEGRNWLFFGEQHFALDFYYQTEIQEWIASGLLTHFDTAFSRDQERKIYVQDRIREKATDFNEWLESGASLYICGQKNPMSTDVENTIIEVIASERNISKEEAKQVLEDLETAGKYQKDVY
ncbi:flavodoxin domain-containing protein [Flavobacterium enshiense]|uniref:diflavin oxidoreductase n=1 Tax=Flavobacterium enshiense TaxID=1341165 RepID=UPI00345D79D2